MVQDRVQDRVQDKVGLRKFSPNFFFCKKPLNVMFDGESVKKKFPFQKILSRISSALFLFVLDLLMLIITKLSICHALKMMCMQQQPHTVHVSLLTRCTWAPTKRCSSPVEAVLTGSRVALPGLVEILRGPCWGHGAIDQS